MLKVEVVYYHTVGNTHACLGSVQVHALDCLGGLISVLVVHAQVDAHGLARGRRDAAAGRFTKIGICSCRYPTQCDLLLHTENDDSKAKVRS